MSNPVIREYLRTVGELYARGNATEHSYRGALQTMIEALHKTVRATNEPKRIRVGAPDFIIQDGETPLGYIEAKDVGLDLDSKDTQKQLARYVDGLGNVILTDYLEFRWYAIESKTFRHRVALASIKGKKVVPEENDEQFLNLLDQFLRAEGTHTVRNAKELALRMAKLADIIRDIILNAINEGSDDRSSEKSAQLNDTMKSFREVLLHDMTDHQFADMYAQTICYGMFAARVNHKPKKNPKDPEFERMTAGYDLPKTNPFLRQLFNTIGGPELDERVTWAVDELANLLRHTAMEDILRDFGTRTRQEDPVVHFYETFLAAYDPKLRESRGVYYTPEPVVSYIVRSVDHILKTDFGLEKGLADSSKIRVGRASSPDTASEELHKVLILDPACGTGTFLHGVIDQIHDNFKGNDGAWSSYVSEHLLPRIFGFELLMAPYAVAHLKLGLQLKEFGYDFKSEERLRVYLTNTLEEAFTADERLPFSNYLAKEANAANEVKRDLPIMVVLGNPPYSNFGMMNKGEWIQNLLSDYKEGLNERKLNLDDDFIKFIRFSHWRIEQTGSGVLAFITNNTYIDGITHRRMRESLLNSFDQIYIVNLHGSANRHETSPKGNVDENVFDIRQGVSIGIFVKTGRERKSKPSVAYVDFWGSRNEKYRDLLKFDISNTKFKKIAPKKDNFFFYPANDNLVEEYSSFYGLNTIVNEYISGVQTKKDELFVDQDAEILKQRIKKLLNSKERINDDEINGFLRESKWILKKLVGQEFDATLIRKYMVSPFDMRYLYYDDSLLGRARFQVMHNMLNENLGLVFMRQAKSSATYDCFLATDALVTDRVFYSAHGAPFLFPLYLYPDATKKDLFSEASPSDPTRREPNLSPAFIAAFSERLNLKFISDGKGNLKKTFGPEDVFHYMYAIFHSPAYRVRYAEFLKIDFPRLPLTSNLELFRALCTLGEQLVSLHLMEKFGTSLTGFRGKGSDIVEYVKYELLAPPPMSEAKRRGLGGGQAEEAQTGHSGNRTTPQPPPPDGGGGVGVVQINEDQYFEGVPEAVWNFHIGGYQVANKWLKDRKNRKLSYDDIEHYHHIISALSETMRLMKEIDEVIAGNSGWPLQ